MSREKGPRTRAAVPQWTHFKTSSCSTSSCDNALVAHTPTLRQFVLIFFIEKIGFYISFIPYDIVYDIYL